MTSSWNNEDLRPNSNAEAAGPRRVRTKARGSRGKRLQGRAGKAEAKGGAESKAGGKKGLGKGKWGKKNKGATAEAATHARSPPPARPPGIPAMMPPPPSETMVSVPGDPARLAEYRAARPASGSRGRDAPADRPYDRSPTPIMARPVRGGEESPRSASRSPARVNFREPESRITQYDPRAKVQLTKRPKGGRGR